MRKSMEFFLGKGVLKKMSIALTRCRKCPWFDSYTEAADMNGVIVQVEGYCNFYDRREIKLEADIKPSWCRVKSATAEEECIVNLMIDKEKKQ